MDEYRLVKTGSDDWFIIPADKGLEFWTWMDAFLDGEVEEEVPPWAEYVPHASKVVFQSYRIDWLNMGISVDEVKKKLNLSKERQEKVARRTTQLVEEVEKSMISIRDFVEQLDQAFKKENKKVRYVYPNSAVVTIDGLSDIVFDSNTISFGGYCLSEDQVGWTLFNVSDGKEFVRSSSADVECIKPVVDLVRGMEDQESVVKSLLNTMSSILQDPNPLLEEGEDFFSITGEGGKISKFKGEGVFEINNFQVVAKRKIAEIQFKGNIYSVRSDLLLERLQSFKETYELLHRKKSLNNLSGKVVDFCDYSWDDEYSFGSVSVVFTDGTKLAVDGSYEEYGSFDFKIEVP